ncbi:hypothetical protein [Bacillus kexueae]|uniref:hypothetical protein n=1 Tax=Aeribacillus kexueae TaxID=2078952 RepID=UPI001FAEA517|nr:hypothetical protein [Bacillus kexueae]
MKTMIAKVVALRKLEELELQLQQIEKGMTERTALERSTSSAEFHAHLDHLTNSMVELNSCIQNLPTKFKNEINPSQSVSFNPSY